MQYDEFVQRVRERAGLDSEEDALSVIEAVLSTLGERVYRTEQSQLAAQLPRGIREFLLSRQPHETTRSDVQTFSVEEFYRRVGARSGVRHARAIELAHAVMAVLREAVTPGQMADIRNELSSDYGVLFENGEDEA
jgi:uncharacterized protein (DUF2267 family)